MGRSRFAPLACGDVEQDTPPKLRISRRLALAAATVVLAIGVIAILTVGGGGQSVDRGDGARPLFSADSPWNTRVDRPGDALDASSALRVRGIVDLVARVKRTTAGSPGTYMAIWAYSTPIYRVDSRQTRSVPVYVDFPAQPHHVALNALLQQKKVPIPAGALPAAGTDGHMTVYDTAKDILYDFWRACPPTPSR